MSIYMRQRMKIRLYGEETVCYILEKRLHHQIRIGISEQKVSMLIYGKAAGLQ